MTSLPPSMWAELFFDSAWNPITSKFRQTSSATVKRGLTAESSEKAGPVSSQLVLDNRDHSLSPRNPNSDLFGKIGRNTPLRWGYNVGSPWVSLPGSTGNKLTAPDNAAFAVTDLDLRFEAALEDWTAQQEFCARYQISGDNRSWALLMSGTGQLQFLWSPDGTLASRIDQLSTIPMKAHNGQRLALRVTLDVDNDDGGYELRFYTGRTVDDEEWSLLGDPVIGGSTTAVFDGAAGIELGEIGGLTAQGMNGKLFAFKLLSGIGVAGVIAAAMYTSDTGAGASSFTSSGLTWTVEGDATLTNKHIRMSSEVPEWPSVRDKSGNNNFVQVAPTDITRRMDAGNKPIDSALLRFIKAAGPIECWPLTDGTQSTVGKSLLGGRDMLPTIEFGTGTVGWAEGTLADWIEPVALVPAETDGTIRGETPDSAAAATQWSVDFFRSGSAAAGESFTIADRGQLTDADPRIAWDIELDAAADEVALFGVSAGETSSSATLLSTITDAGIFTGTINHIRLTVTPGGSDSAWELFLDGASRDSGTYAPISKAVRSVRAGWFASALTIGLPSLGYVTYWDGAGPTAAEIWDAATGFQGEKAGARIERLATEAGYIASVAGESAFQQPMGIQDRKKLLALFNEANQTNFGYLVGARDRNELIHRGQSTLWNQPPGLTLDFSAGLLDDYRYRDDDLLTENDVSVEREFGSVPARQVLEEGELSVQDPPAGVGRYDNKYTYSLFTDDQAIQVAGMRLHLGTYNGVRYPRITIDLANERVFQMIDDILRLDVGDKVRLTNVPIDTGPDDVDVLIAGYAEEAGPRAWKITFICVPAEPWTALVATQAPSTVVEGFEDASLDITVTDGGTLPWLRTNTQAHTGTWSFRSGAITNNQTSVAVITVPDGATWLTFWYRTSSEDSGVGFEGDRLTVDVDATQVLRAQGEVDWTVFAIDVTGAASVTLTYAKDNSVASGEDAVYVDDITFTIPTSLTTESRADTGGCELAEALDATETGVDVTTTGLQRWVDSAAFPAEFPFDIRVGGTGSEVMRVTVCTGTTLSQTFTVTRSINGVVLAHSTGDDVRLAHPVYLPF